MTTKQTGPMTLGISDRRRDHILVTIWFITSFRQFPGDELILYPLALYFAWAFVRDFLDIFPMVARSFILFLFPIWWMLSALWGVETGLIIKSGLQLFLTIIICYCMATRLTARDIIVSLMIASGIFAVWSFYVGLNGSGIAARGVFASKNSMGAAMIVLWLSAICVLFDSWSSKPAKWIAFFALLLAAWQINVSDSATAVLLAVGITLLVVVFGVLPSLGVLRRPGFYVGSLVFIGIGLLGLSSYSTANDLNPITTVLDALGKDTTLTGRTVLWEYAKVQIRQEPLLGVGAGGFWTPFDGLSEARKIYEEFHKVRYAHFSFHNSFYSIAVHQGLIGLGIVVTTTAWLIIRILLSFGSADRITVVFFICITGVTLARSITEVGLLSPFSLMSMLFVVGALLPLRER